MDDKNNTLGLVLSGGGTKGIAHAGVLQFLEEQQLKPTMMAGTSAGAIVACLYAWGKSPEEILDFFKSIYFFHWRHFTLRKPGIVDSQAFEGYFNEIFGDATMSDLPIKTYITATDMVKGKLKIFDGQTKITDAVLASSSFPGILSPHKVNHKLYSDGGILNHFPTDLLQGHCDTLIGVYVSPIQKIEAKDLNSIKAVTARAFDLLSANGMKQKFSLCDWVIEPTALCGFGTFETGKEKMNTIFKLGYEAAEKSFEIYQKNQNS